MLVIEIEGVTVEREIAALAPVARHDGLLGHFQHGNVRELPFRMKPDLAPPGEVPGVLGLDVEGGGEIEDQLTEMLVGQLAGGEPREVDLPWLAPRDGQIE